MKQLFDADKFIEEAGSRGIVPGLASICRLMDCFLNPQEKLNIIHVVGTNGKGSTTTFFANGLMTLGYKVGVFMSPAVFDPLEIISINNTNISKKEYDKLLEEVSIACDKIANLGFDKPTMFEIQVALAIVYFSRNKCDYVVLEAGMGGELDATNVTTNSLMTIITSIGEDHIPVLGANKSEIARTKAKIISKNSLVVSAIQDEDVLLEIKNECEIKNAKLYIANNNYNCTLSTDTIMQKDNAAVAFLSLEVLLNSLNIDFDTKIINETFSKIVMPGRFEKIQDNPKVYLDGAHNYPAAVALKREILHTIDFTNDRVTYIIGVLSDKAYDKVLLELLPYANDVVFITPQNARALDANKLANCAGDLKNEYGLCFTSYIASDFEDAKSKALATNSDYVFCFGSLSHLKDLKSVFLEEV